MTLDISSLSFRRKQRLSHRRFVKGVMLGTLGFCTGAAVDALGIEPEWIEVVNHDLRLPGLPKAFAGRRIVQISDLHLSTTVSCEYLRRCFDRINHLNADIILLTGDYVTYDGRGKFREQLIEMLDLKARLGVFACMGNHDYGISNSFRPSDVPLLNFLTEGMQNKGITVLRNQSAAVNIGAERIWLVGLGDLWADDCHPRAGFTGVPDDEVTLVLVHNPDSLDRLIPHNANAIFCGHTHGGQFKIPFLGPPILPIRNRQYSAGMFDVGGRKLYVNRGLGRLGRIRFNCRPEITIFHLRPA